MAKAAELYQEFLDMDSMDYSETYESDLLFIAGLIDLLGVNGARKALESIVNA